MTDFRARRPHPDDYMPYFQRYIDRVPDGDVAVTMQRHVSTSLTTLRGISEAQAEVHLTPESWTAKQTLGHLTDSERIFADRALRFARGETQPLPGFEPLEYMRAASFDRRTWADLIDEFETVRRATVSLFLSFDQMAWERRGVASDQSVSVRALAFIIVGHAVEHLAMIGRLAVTSKNPDAIIDDVRHTHAS